MSNDQIRKIAALEDAADFKKLLDPIMVPRVVGTPSHEKVKNVKILENKFASFVETLYLISFAVFS